jgi:hypothetical protein
MPIHIALAIALFVATSGASATTWVVVGDNPSATVEVDQDGVSREGTLVRAWFRWNYTPALYTSPERKAYQSMKELNWFNCAKRQYAIAQQVGYAEPNGGGESVFSATFSPSRLEYSEVIPESIGESMLLHVCKQPRKKL